MRTITTFAGSSPTYHFTITDYAGANISVEEMGIGIVIYNGNDKTYIVPQTVKGLETSSFLYYVAGAVIISNDELCRYLGDGKFAITIPCSADLSGEYNFEAFIFKYEQLDSPKVYSNVAVAGAARLTMIVIDSGTIEFIANALPSYEPINSTRVSLIKTTQTVVTTPKWNLDTL